MKTLQLWCKNMYRKRGLRKLCIGFVSTIIVVIVYHLISPVFNTKYGNKIPVCVVEEHHEALPYWIDVANEGVIRKKGNTLIHIDGHSDDGLPHYILAFPFFRWPENEFEVFLMMQQNDLFIVEGVIIGLIDRFIWISPEWNKETEDVEHSIDTIEIGWTKIKRKSGEEIVFCKCVMEDTNNGNTPELYESQKSCSYFNDSFQPPGNPEIKLEATSLCDIKAQYTFEVLSAKKAIELMTADPTWITPQESVILDIDEDYFGCEIPGQKLYDVGMTWTNFESLNGVLSVMFCPRHIDHEKSGSEVMNQLLNIILTSCGYNENNEITHNGNFTKQCKVSIKTLTIELYGIVLESWKHDPLLYCSRNNRDLKFAVHNLTEAFYFLSPTKLNMILHIGFCFNTSPQTIWFDDEGHLVICHGSNDPLRPMVQVYVPKTKDELTSSFHVVTSFLDVLPKPGVVTLCRSIRDGYTPRVIFKKVEDFLLKYFLSQMKVIEASTQKYTNMFEVIYDENLLNSTYGLNYVPIT